MVPSSKSWSLTCDLLEEALERNTVAAVTFRISLGMIVKNEGRTLEACLASVAPFVDEIVIGLGGESTDDTEEIARRYTDKIFPIEWHDDFSEARNQVLARVSGDYFMWIDGDDVLEGGEHIGRLLRENSNVDHFFMGYDYAQDENGSCVCYLVRERIVRLQDELPERGWNWIGKIHEVLAPVGFEATPKLVSEVLVRHHKPANKHEPDRNIKILYEQLAEQEPNPDPRILGYLCTENLGRGNFQEAILHGQRFVKVSGWAEERYQMQHRISDMYRMMGKFKESLESEWKAIAIQPDWPDAFFGLAETFSLVENWRGAVEMIKAGSTKPAPQTTLILNPFDYSYSPVVVLANAYVHLNDFEMALANYEKAYEIKQEPLIGQQIELLKNEIQLHRVVDAFLLLREHLARNDEWLKVRKLFDAVPKHVEQYPTIQETWQRTSFQTGHVIDPQIMIDFYTGNPHWQAIPEETIEDPSWLEYPRMKFAIDTAKRIGAETVVDWGCSDGFIALPLAKATGARVTGFDLDPRCVDLATLRAERWGVHARFQVGNVDEIGGWEGDKADLGIFFEVIEHVVDPSRTLEKLEKTAKHIIMTTPYLSWESGNIVAWDRLEPKGHLRIFDQYDLEKIIGPRGRIWNLYREPWSNKGWLFAEYTPGVTTNKTIMIGAMGAPEAWNPRSWSKGGLGGSETAVLKLGSALALAGHRAVVYTSCDEPGYYEGVCYRDSSHYRPEIPSDMYIAWRQPEAADWGINTKQLVLWMHDTDAGDRLTQDRARKFDKIVVLSEWHKQNMMTLYPFIPEEKYLIIGNGVDKERFNKKIKRNPKRVIYSSSPDRGLDIILEGIWPKVIEAVPDAELHFYYGWNNFDKFAADYPHLVEFKKKIQSLMLATEGVVQHGRINQAQLAKAFMKSSVWLYPTYFSETYCITAIEAQLGGAIPITNRLAALNETVVSGIDIPGDVHDPEVQNAYAQSVIHVLTHGDDRELRERIRENAPAITWDQVADAWLQLLEGEVTSGERPVRRGEKLLPAGINQLADNADQGAASLDR